MAADPAAADAAEIRTRALRLLARREHAPLELAAKLRQRGFPAATVERVVSALAAEDLLSARRYAETVVYARAGRGYGPLRIRAELSAKGVDDALIAAALGGADTDWDASAVAERCKRFGRAAPADFAAKARQMRFLQQRGFTGDQIGAALAAAGT